MAARNGKITVGTALAGLMVMASTMGCEESGVCPETGPLPGESCVATLSTRTGEVRSYRLHAPDSYVPGSPLPLVLNLPGLGEPADLHELGTQMSTKADEEDFIVAYPEPIGTQWRTGSDSTPDVDFLMEMLGEIEGKMSIDSKRIYATGVSSGGAMVHDLACTFPDRFAGIGMIAPALTNPVLECAATRAIPTIIISGGQDGVVPWAGNFFIQSPQDVAAGWALRNGAGDTPSYVADPLVDTWEWLHPTTPDGDVELMLVHELGHFWPTERIHGFEGTDALWSFLADHAQP